ncbi:hypothetical protein RB597_008385 [Gaeumannomyces tritici]
MSFLLGSLSKNHQAACEKKNTRTVLPDSQATAASTPATRLTCFRLFGPADTLASPSFLWSKGPSPGQGDAPRETAPKTMPAHPDRPPLAPQLCFSTSALRDFLRLSRGAIDDSISQNLNALVTPAKDGFDPSTTSQRIPRPLGRPIDGAACRQFKQDVLFPSWKTRSDLISYCTMVATSPDPNDPSVAIREAEESKNKERVIDERLDPYSARFFPTEPRTERLAILLRQERGVERIVRRRTWEVINERCGSNDGESWEEAFDKWQKAARQS